MTAFMLLGDLVEYSPTKELFLNPRDERTENYISGRFG
jgi:phosphate transport system ATP-binding protein